MLGFNSNLCANSANQIIVPILPAYKAVNTLTSSCFVADMSRRKYGSKPFRLTAGSRHIMTHSKGFACHFCDKSFSAKQDLEGHINVQHLNCKPYQCPVCSKAFAYEKTLKCHQRMTHYDTQFVSDS